MPEHRLQRTREAYSDCERQLEVEFDANGNLMRVSLAALAAKEIEDPRLRRILNGNPK